MISDTPVDKLSPFVTAISILASGIAFAADCDKVVKEDAIQQCLSTELSAADRELNATYAKLRRGMGTESLDMLTKAQKLWISLRDADCELDAEAYKSGTAYQAIYLQCQINKTRQRTSELKKSTHTGLANSFLWQVQVQRIAA